MAVKNTSAKKARKRKIVVGNWKMYITSVDEAKHVAQKVKSAGKKLKNVITVICPPYVYLGLVKSDSSLVLGVQNVTAEEKASSTGEVNTSMLSSFGVEYIILGHSERRKMGETDDLVAEKVLAVSKTPMKFIVCIGEEVRDDHGEYLEFLKNQIKNSLSKIQKKQVENLIIAYEPVWAIGATSAMTPSDVYETSIFIKKILSDMYGQDCGMSVPILYGGAVTFRNAAEIVRDGQVDGLLIGRESANAPGFVEILKAVDVI